MLHYICVINKKYILTAVLFKKLQVKMYSLNKLDTPRLGKGRKNAEELNN